LGRINERKEKLDSLKQKLEHMDDKKELFRQSVEDLKGLLKIEKSRVEAVNTKRDSLIQKQ
jgi:hypothetical protein